MTLQIISNDDDTWDDIDIEDDSFTYRTSRGIYSYYPDKDQLGACRTALSPSFSDDDDTISTAASLQSVDDHDYPLSEMGDFGTPTDGASTSYTTKLPSRNCLNLSASSFNSKIESNSSGNHGITSRNNSLFDLMKDYEGRGTITRLGRTGGFVHVDTGDWSYDVNVPSTLKLSTKLGFGSNKASSQQTSTGSVDNGEGDNDRDPFADLQEDNDTGNKSTMESSHQNYVRFDQVTTATDLASQRRSAKTSTPQQKWQEEKDDEGFDDIDIPTDIGTRSISLHHQQWPTSTSTCSNNKASPLPPYIQKKLSRFKECDTDDFSDGLVIKQDAFKVPPSSNSTKEMPTSESKLPRPKRSQQQKTASTIHPPTASSSRKKTLPHENRWDRLTAPTYASRQRGTNTTPTTSAFSPMMRTRQNNPHSDQIKPRTGLLPSSSRSSRLPPTNSHPTNKYRNAASTSGASFMRPVNGSTLTTKPRTGRINYGNGSELDHLDDLPVWKKPFSDGPKTVSSTRKSDTSSKPWRSNMSKRNLALIKPNEQKMEKEINGMRYDQRTRQWHGNEQATQAFDAPAKRRPALIKNMMTSRATKSRSSLVVGNMTFDQQKMSWNTYNGEEVDVLAHIDDLSENEPQRQHYRRQGASGMANHTTPTTDSNHLNDASSPIFYPERVTPSSRLCNNSSLIGFKKATPSLIAAESTNLTSLSPADSLDHQDRLIRTPPSSGLHGSSAGIREFYLPIDMQVQMAEQEQEHKEYFSAWPLRNKDEMIETPTGSSVPQNTYILY